MLQRRRSFSGGTHHTWNPMASATAVALQQKSSSLGIASHTRLGIVQPPLVRAFAAKSERKQ